MTILGPFFVTIKYVYVGYDIESVSTYQLYLAQPAAVKQPPTETRHVRLAPCLEAPRTA